MYFLIAAAGVLVLLLMVLIFFGFWGFERSFKRKNYPGDPIEAAVNKVGNRPYNRRFKESIYWFRNFKNKEEVYVNSNDGLKLKGYYLKNPSSAGKVMILCHGYRSFPYFDFSASAKEYYEQGFDLLLIVQRAHLDSEGKYITFGLKERFDLLKWIEYVDSRHNGKAQIILAGVSMGASTVMFTLGLKLPQSVKGAVCDCGFDCPKAIIEYNMRSIFKFKWLSRLLAKFVSLASFIKTGYFLNAANTAKSLKNNTLPVMFAHGKADTVVPFEMFENNISVGNFEKILVTSDLAAHGLVFYYEHEKYMSGFEKLQKAALSQLK